MLNIVGPLGMSHDVCVQLYFLDQNFPEAKLESALKWLLANNLRGQAFVEWFKFECKSSNLEMHRKLLVAVEQPTTSEVRRILAGKDFN